MSKHAKFGSFQSHRQLRVAELIRRTLASLLLEGVQDEPDLQCASITVGEVKLSPDLRNATVFVLPLGGTNAEEVVAALNRRKAEIRKSLNRAVSLKRSPSLTFVSDRLFDQMEDMRRLFDRDDIRKDLAHSDSAAES
ncbi:MAG: 30S ribosome-binding factor RbfA [Rhodobacteraceae bacterium]|nr:30S ribosome-binding factor RbfA [Paracoccaceae bacterium]